jgi:hypothetical protein
MTLVVDVPATFDERSMDQFASAIGAWPPEARVLFNAKATHWVSPYGLVVLLTAAQALIEAGRERPLLALPDAPDVTGATPCCR